MATGVQTRKLRDHTSASQKKLKEWPARLYKLSKPTANDILPLARLDVLKVP